MKCEGTGRGCDKELGSRIKEIAKNAYYLRNHLGVDIQFCKECYLKSRKLTYWMDSDVLYDGLRTKAEVHRRGRKTREEQELAWMKKYWRI